MAGLDMDFSGIADGLEHLTADFPNACLARLETSATQLESYAKQNRPWTDRTGHARQRLNCRASRQSATQYRLTLAHGVSYGVNLEFKHNKRYAIIFPTLEAKGPEVMQAFQGFLEAL